MENNDIIKELQVIRNSCDSLIAKLTEPAPTPAPVSDVIPFNGNLQSGTLNAYAKNAIINPSCIMPVSTGDGSKSMLFSVPLGSTAGITSNSRAQLQTPNQYKIGQEVFARVKFVFVNPDKFWTEFLTLAEFYGLPYNGTSPFKIGVQESNLVLTTTVPGKQTNVWSVPLEVARTYDFIYRQVLSEENGEVQAWLYNPVLKEYMEILPTLKTPGIIKAVNGGGDQYHKIANYYSTKATYTDKTKKVKVSSISIAFLEHRVGGTFNDVL